MRAVAYWYCVLAAAVHAFPTSITPTARQTSRSSRTDSASLVRKGAHAANDRRADPGVDNESNKHTHEMNCRSNSTHIAWKTLDDYGDDTCSWETVDDTKREAYYFLKDHVMAFDVPFMETLGFSANNNIDNETLPDGLADGLIQPTIDLAVRAKQAFASTDRLPKDIWQNYVLNYANLNEARNNIRPILWDRLVIPLFLSDPEIYDYAFDDKVLLLNTHMWTLLAPPCSQTTSDTSSTTRDTEDTSRNDEDTVPATAETCTIRFVSGQTPVIFDPMSILVYGFASCTGLAILLVQALRAAGVPARVAGTPAWHGTEGNHNWVEVYTGSSPSSARVVDAWSFLEPSPAQDVIDSVWRDPCERWFCNDSYMRNGTQLFAAQLAPSDTYFPLAWEENNRDVPAESRTIYYYSICSPCGMDDPDPEIEIDAASL